MWDDRDDGKVKRAFDFFWSDDARPGHYSPQILDPGQPRHSGYFSKIPALGLVVPATDASAGPPETQWREVPNKCGGVVGPVDQLGDRLHGMEKAEGSSPFRSSNSLPLEPTERWVFIILCASLEVVPNAVR